MGLSTAVRAAVRRLRRSPQYLVDPVTGATVRFISRAEAGLPPSHAPHGRYERREAITHHGVGRGEGLSLAAITALWRGYHRYHTKIKRWTDIAYTWGWADAPDVGGAVLEGRWWGRNGGHTQNGGNIRGYAGCYIGDGRYTAGADTAWAAHRAAVAEGQRVGAFTDDVNHTGHDDWFKKNCPGALIKQALPVEMGRTAPAPEDEEDPMRLWIVGTADKDLYLCSGTQAVHVGERDDNTVAVLAEAYGVTAEAWPGNADSFVDAHTISAGGGTALPRESTERD